MARNYLFLFSFFLPVVVLAQQPELILPTGHTEIVRVARFSTDGKYVLTGGADKTVNIWETLSGKKIQSLGGNNSDISYTFFSNDSRYIAAGTDSTVRIWSAPAYTLLGEYNLIRKIVFSPDGKKVFLIGFDGIIRQISLPSMTKEYEYKDSLIYNRETIRTIAREAVSPDSRLFCSTNESSYIIRDIKSGNVICKKPLNGKTKGCFFTNDGLYLITVTENGIQQTALKNHFTVSVLSGDDISSAFLSRSNKFLLAASGDMDNNAVFWDFEKYKPLFRSDTVRSVSDTFQVMNINSNYVDTTGSLPYNFPHMLSFQPLEISRDGKFIKSMNLLWNTADPMQSYRIDNQGIRYSDISYDSKYLLLQERDGEVDLWDIAARKIIQRYRTRADNIRSVALSPDGQKFILTSYSKTVKITDVKTGKTMHVLQGHTQMIVYAAFSKDGKKVLTNSYDSTAKLWDAETGALLQNFPNQYPEFNPAYFNATGELVQEKVIKDSVQFLTIDGDSKDTVLVHYRSDWDDLPNRKSKTGRYQLITTPEGWIQFYDSLHLYNIPDGTYGYSVNAFSPDEKMLASSFNTLDTLLVWDIGKDKWAFHGKLGIIAKNPYGHKGFEQLLFTPDNKYLLVADVNAVIHGLSTADFKEAFTLPGQRFHISADGNYLLAISQGKCDVYDFKKRKLLYTYLSVDSVNYLVIDPQRRFDGTEMARKLLYYACGNELVDLDQAKDQLWVPDLAERIMKGDSLNTKTLDQLNICGLTPEIEDAGSKADEYYFKIIPRRGGLGETVLFVNGIEAKRYQSIQLNKKAGFYELRIKKNELKDWFIAGKENRVTVKAYTSGNGISSRGLIINEDRTKEATASPSLYAVLVGVSDYKGNELDLKYAAKDATDISFAIAHAAKKLLNTDNREHVFMYNLTTAKDHYQLPEKIAIKKTLEEIGQKAAAGDILLIFFAGHGVMAGEAGKKQFYFLTADASQASVTGAIADVGISTTELTEWMKPQNIKAQKRILIFDACNSGQAIKDFIKMGKEDQGYMAARNDDKAQQVKAIDKLNEKSGLFILSASASDQNAYEMGRYSQGLLTYSLLQAMKQQPDILEEGKYLSISRWFNAAEKTVSELSKESGARQEPQIVSNTNFNIGIVDDEVIAKIILPGEKPLFAASNFQNSNETADGDNLDFSKLINLQLNEMAARGADSKIVYVMATNSPDAITLSGRYDVKDNEIVVRISIKKNNETKYRFEEKGTKEKLKELATNLVVRASEWAATDK